MPVTREWTAGISDDFNVDGNWDSGAGLVPVGGDSIVCGELAAGPMLTGLNQSGKTFARLDVFPGFKYSVASPSAPFQCGITDLTYRGVGAQSYIKGAITRGLVAVPTGNEDALLLESAFTSLAILAGGVTMIGSQVAAVGSAIYLGAGDGSVEVGYGATLTVPATVDLATNSTLIRQINGTLSLSTDAGTIKQSGGEATLDAAATLALLDKTGGTFVQRSTGTIAAVHTGGGDFRLGNGQPRTISAFVMYGGANADLSAGQHLTLTAGVRNYGSGELILPLGMQLDAA